MKRLSIKFIAGGLLMFGLSFIYTAYMFFRVFEPKSLLWRGGQTLDYLKKGFAYFQVPPVQIFSLFLDSLLIFILIMLLWYFMVRFFITPNLKYFKLFIILFATALIYFSLPYLIVPNSFCEKYDHGAICPSFCSIKFKVSPIPEAYSRCIGPVLPQF